MCTIFCLELLLILVPQQTQTRRHHWENSDSHHIMQLNSWIPEHFCRVLNNTVCRPWQSGLLPDYPIATYPNLHLAVIQSLNLWESQLLVSCIMSPTFKVSTTFRIWINRRQGTDGRTECNISSPWYKCIKFDCAFAAGASAVAACNVWRYFNANFANMEMPCSRKICSPI